MRALPGHAARLRAELDKSTLSTPDATHLFETFLYRRCEYEDANAAAVVTWCAKWLIGKPDTRTEYEQGAARKTPIGDLRGWKSRTTVINNRDDFAANAFIALRLMAEPGDMERIDQTTTRQDTRLAKLRESGGEVVRKNGDIRIKGITGLVASEAAAGAHARTEKTIRADLKAAFNRETEAKRSGVFDRLGFR